MHGAVFVEAGRRDDRVGRLASMPLWAWSLVAVVIFALLDLRTDPLRLVTALGDADDATRLVQVKALLGGASWFDRTLPQIGAPEPLVSHWSRLIDAPLALMLASFARLMPAAQAELAVRALWPLLVFLPLLFLLARDADRTAGRGAAAAALALAIYAHSGVIQFGLGRIDHHNVMILSAVGGTLLLAEAFVSPRMGWFAGSLLGLGVVIGYEGLALTGLVMAAATLHAAHSGRGLDGVTNTATAFAATLALGLELTETPRQWLTVHCDALSANMVLLAAAGAGGLAIVRRAGADWTPEARLAVVTWGGLVGAGAFAFAEPACLAGPFAQMDPTVKSLWLDHVEENHNLWASLDSQPLATAQYIAASLIGVAAGLWQLRRRPDAVRALPLAALLIALAISAVHIKLMPYATFLAIVPVAVTIAELPGIGSLSALSSRLLAFLAVNQHTILGVLMIGASVGASEPAEKAGSWAAMSESLDACTSTRAITPLAALPPGLIVADIDFGSFIAALSPHRVLAAPYHRIDKAMLQSFALRADRPPQAEQRLRELQVDYVAVCRAASASAEAGTLLAELEAGTAPSWLQPVALSGPSPYRVWRLTPAAATLPTLLPGADR